MKTPFIICVISLLLSIHPSKGVAFQGPGGEVINRPSPPSAPVNNRPPPINNSAALRAEQAARAKRKAAIADQVELAVKNGNKAMDDYMFDQSKKQLLVEAESNYKKAAQLKPNDWRAYSGLGNLYYWATRLPESEAAYKRAIALNPRDAELQKLLARSYSGDISRTPESDVAARKQKSEQELLALKRAAELDPSPGTRLRLAEAYGYLKMYDQAIATYKSILANLPTRNVKSLDELLDIHTNLARTYEDAERYPEAIAEYKEAIRLKPDWAIQYNALARVLVKAKRYSEAIEAFKKEDQLHPERGSELRIGQVYAEAGEYDKAIAIFNGSALERPDDWEPIASLGYVYYLQKQYAKSLEQMQRALRLNQDIPGLRYYKGVDHLMLGQRNEALQEYEILKVKSPGFAQKLKIELDKQK